MAICQFHATRLLSASCQWTAQPAVCRRIEPGRNRPYLGRILALGSKTNLSYHLAKLREAGITRTEVVGTSRLITLRRADLDSRFPGLLDSIIAGAGLEAIPRIEEAFEAG